MNQSISGAVSMESTQEPSSFLHLPAEIRNEIYRRVLLMRNVTTRKPCTNEIFRTPGEVSDGATSVQPGAVAIGTIRCESWRTYTMGYQIALILTNRQVYREAWGIFHLENFWTLVRVNKAGFAKEMKDRNFPVGVVDVATADNLWRHGKYPVMKVMVNFPSLADQKQSDVLVVATAHLKSLVRALWTAKGASEMEIMVHVLPPCVPNAPSEGHLLRPFLKLRSIKRLVVVGVSNEHVDRLTRGVKTTGQIFGELMEGAKSLQVSIGAEYWELAAAQEEDLSMLMTDCLVVYGNRFMDSRAGKDILITTFMSVAEMSLYRTQYTRTISFADYVLDVVYRVPVSQNVPVVQPTAASFREIQTKCHILLIRARAYIGMRQAESAFSDIEKAREVMPNSLELAPITEAWQVMFGPSAPPPTAS